MAPKAFKARTWIHREVSTATTNSTDRVANGSRSHSSAGGCEIDETDLAGLDVDPPKSLPLQAAQRPPQLLNLVADHMRAKLRSGRARMLSWQSRPAGRGRSPRAGSGTRGPVSRPGAPRAARSSRRRRSAAPREPFRRRCSGARANASFVAVWSFSSSATNARQVSDDRTSVGLKCLPRERTIFPTRRPDEHDERELRNRLIVLVRLSSMKIAICVGGSPRGSSGPIGRNRLQ